MGPVAFPEDPLGVRVDIQAGGEWLDVTGDVYTRDPLTIAGGRSDEASSADPGTCTLTFNNRDGVYSPKNPRSPLFGRIGRNTPLRVSVPAGDSHMDLDGQPANYAATPDAPALGITGDLDVRMEIGTEWWGHHDTNRVLLSRWDPAGDQRSWNLRVYEDLIKFSWTPDGTYASQLTVSATLQRLPHRAAVRATLDADDGTGVGIVAISWAEALEGPWYPIYTWRATAPLSIYDSTAPLRIGSNDPTANPPQVPFAGEAYRAEVRNGIDGPVVAAPDFRPLAPGVTAFTDAAGRPWTLAGTAAISNRSTRFYGEVSSWPPKWAASGADVWVPVEASGILRRLGQGAKPLDSTMKRRIPSFNPVAYWPMEDGQDARQMYSPIPGVTPLQLYGTWQMAADDTLTGSSSLPQLGEGAELRGAVPRATGNGWQVEFVYRIPVPPTTEQTLIRVAVSGTYRHFRVTAATGSIKVYSYDDDGTETLVANGGATMAYGQWARFQMWATQSGNKFEVHTAWIVLGSSGYQVNATVNGQAGRITGVYTPFGAFEDTTFGHLTVFHGSEVNTFTGADLGFIGETTRNRMRRLAQEEAVPLALTGDQTTAPQMGPQRPETLLDLFAEAAEVDGGMFGEERESLSLLYRSRESLYGQQPVLTLDYRAGEIAPPLEPVDDDQRVRNDITVTRERGSSARAVQEDGPMSVQPPPAGVGVYNEALTLNLYDDTQTDAAAGWRLHLGTWDEARYPAVTLRLHRAPHLIPAFLKLRAGDKIRLANLPEWLPPGDVDLLVEGWTETLLPRQWDVTLACSPAGPWDIGVADADDFGRVDTDGSHIAAADTVSENFEDATYAVPTLNGGDAAWFRTEDSAHTGTWSLRSGPITAGQSSQFAMTVPAAAHTMTFWYATSTEPAGETFEGDPFVFFLDGVEYLRDQGEVDWTQVTVNVASVAQVVFVYAKDAAEDEGEDAVWIDDVTFFSGGPVSAGDTTFTVVTDDGQPWTTDPAEGAFDITVGGEVMTVTTVTGSSSPQTFTVTRGVNGVTKPHPEGSDVRLAQPAIVGM